MVLWLAVSVVGAMLMGWIIFGRKKGAKKQYSRSEKRKIAQINLAIDFVQRKLPSSILLGGSATNLSFYEIYATVEHRDEFLKVLEERFNREMGGASPVDWYAKIEELGQKGEQSLGAYISGYAGQQAENIAVEMFRQQGLNAELFESRIHPNDDIRVYNEDGGYTDYSLKSYGNLGNFEKEIANHPESTHYVVNEELYEKLEATGRLEQYDIDGITILNGHYFNEELREDIFNVFDELSEAGDVSNKIPLISTVFFGAKILQNSNAYLEGKQSGYEMSINVAGDAVKVSTHGVGGMAGAKAGAAIGSFVTPGLGTVIGGGIGAVVGAFSASGFIEMVKSKFKWGDIFEATEYFGKTFSNFERNRIYISHNAYNLSTLKQELMLERKRMRCFRNELNLANDTPVSLPAILPYLHIRRVEEIIHYIPKATEQALQEITLLCEQLAQKMVGEDFFDQEEVIKNRFLGEIMLSNRELFLPEYKLTEDEKALIEQYDLQVKRAPNHPYRVWKGGEEELVQGLFLRALETVLRSKAGKICYRT